MHTLPPRLRILHVRSPARHTHLRAQEAFEKWPDAEGRQCVRRPSGAPGAFSLVEVVIAVGLISFCLLAIVGLMATAHQSSREADERTATTLILQSAYGVFSSLPFNEMRSALGQPNGVWMGFEREGRFLGRTNSASGLTTNTFYRVQLRPVNAAALTNVSHLRAVAMVSFPPPVFSQTNSFPVSFVRYGAQF